MEWEGLLVIGLTFGALILLVLEKASLDAIGIGLLVVLVATSILDPEQALGGFANHAVVTIGALYVVGEGLTRTGALEFLARWVLKYSGGSERRMVLLMGLVAAFISAFANNTVVLVVFIPVVIGMCRSAGLPASRLLMPLSFASLLGGMCTLVGTSTNLLVSGVTEELLGEDQAITMFEMSPLGIPMALAGIAFMALFAKKILPVRQSLTSMMAATHHREYVTELVIGPKSDLLGKTFGDAFGSRKADVLFFVREEAMHWPPFDIVEIEAGDAVMLRGKVDDLAELQAGLGLKLIGDVTFDPRSMSFFELAVSPRSSAVGRPVSELHLWRDFGVVAVAVLRSGHHIHDRVSNLALRPGDLILACGEDHSLEKLRASVDFYLLTGTGHRMVLRGYARRALVISGLVVCLFSLYSVFRVKLVPIPIAALLGAMAMVALGCVSPRRAYRAVDWPILVFVVGALALGKAMETTGAAAFLAGGLIKVLSDYGPAFVASGLVLICIFFNALISHAAVAVILTPIAVAAAQAMADVEGLLPGEPRAQAITRTFILAIAFGGSLCFATPIGHQTNLMVYGPGGYRYSDFLRLGLWLSLLTWIMVSVGLPLLTGI